MTYRKYEDCRDMAIFFTLALLIGTIDSPNTLAVVFICLPTSIIAMYCEMVLRWGRF